MQTEVRFLGVNLAKTLKVKMTTIHDCSMNSVYANEGYRHCLRRQFDLNSISNTVKILHTIWYTRSWLILSTGCWDIKQVKSVCNPCKMELKSRITFQFQLLMKSNSSFQFHFTQAAHRIRLSDVPAPSGQTQPPLSDFF